jgi:hypothetical protein
LRRIAVRNQEAVCPSWIIASTAGMRAPITSFPWPRPPERH